MKKDQLQLAPGLSVPAAIAARTVFLAGTKGSGKTHNAGVLAEEMLAAGMHLVVLDPMGVWWGLRHDAGGGPGGHPVYILGGEHGDAPLPPTSGEVVAEFVVGRGQSVILDMSGFGSNADQDRFVTAFAAKLFRLKAAEKSALHLIMDEADQFMPQQPQSGTEIPLLGATKTIVTKGRSRGLSMTMITQRPQSIAKAAIEEADVVLCHRMQGVNAVKAMRAWTDLYATKEQAAEFFDTLPRLADGECWVWSPQFLKRFERHQFRRKTTFDSSRTPDPGEVARRPKAAAAVDLGKLTADMAATAEAARANDPAELRRRLAAAEERADWAAAARSAPAAAPEVKVIERPVLKEGQLARAEALVQTTFDRIEKNRAKEDVLVAKLAEAMRPLAAARQQAEQWRSPTPSAPSAPASAAAAPVDGGPGSPDVGKGGLRRILIALAQRPAGLTVGQIGVRAGLSSKSGTFDTYMSRARKAGWVRDEAERKHITDAGRAALGSYVPLPTGRALLDHWVKEFGKSGAGRILTAVAAAHPRPLSNEEIGTAAGVSPNSSTFDTYMSRLRTLELIQGGRGATTASPDLFGT